MSKKIYYFPILKTTDAELKAYRCLDPSVKDNILPVFELTKSRKTKKNLESKLEKKLDKLVEAVNKNPFIIDLTTETSYSNKEIERMIYDGSNGYKKWVDFLKKIKNERFPSIIPMVNYHPQKIKNVKMQTISLGKSFNYLAFRADVFQDETLEYIKNFLSFCKELQSHNKIIIILDGKFIPIYRNDKFNKFQEKVKEISNIASDKIHAFVYAFSSFPKSVREKGYNGEDSYGEFKITETEFQSLFSSSKKVYHGDYGSIHPARYDTGGGGWIPRIDVVSSNEKTFFYHRYRRNDGSYGLCAKEILKDEKYHKIAQDTWGDKEIQYASQDKPRGKNPSHWIAVRSNLYMTRQCFRLKKNPIKKYLSLSL